LGRRIPEPQENKNLGAATPKLHTPPKQLA
jgi:hypothetical protein